MPSEMVAARNYSNPNLEKDQFCRVKAAIQWSRIIISMKDGSTWLGSSPTL